MRDSAETVAGEYLFSSAGCIILDVACQGTHSEKQLISP